MPLEIREIDRSELKKGGGYLVTPGGPGQHPGVVVIHEIHGLNDNIKEVTRRFGKAGYIGLAVDLFTDRNRAVCMTRYMTGLLIGSVNRYGISELKAALTYLAKNRDVDAQRMGAIGFCMGGGFAIAWACTDSRLKAIAPVLQRLWRLLHISSSRRLLGSLPEVLRRADRPENDRLGTAA